MGRLYNRMTRNIFLKPFNLSETEIFLKNKGIDWSRYDITECYMILGGIPYYLNLLQREKTYQKNIDELFSKQNPNFGMNTSSFIVRFSKILPPIFK